ncbi:glycosyltransferase [Desulfamplus magnetovallimortis]|nr:glycosyltransferase [Desulfamplus magnetovallimortis]
MANKNHLLHEKRIPRILLFSPHFDDEITGAGGFLALAASNSWNIKIIYVTKKEQSYNINDLTNRRLIEAQNALSELGLNKNAIDIWNYSYGSIPLSGQILEEYKSIFNEFSPDILLLPSPTDPNDDHRNVTRGCIKALEGNIEKEIELRFYECIVPSQINYVENISEVFHKKQKAVLCHQSQLGRSYHARTIESLAALRGSCAGCSYGEGYLLFPWSGSQENFFEQRPLVSVILRSSRSFFLKRALSTVLDQTYDQVEVIVVWFGEESPVLPSEMNLLDLKIINGQNGYRGKNLNTGIKNSRGDYISFLDEDDLWEPDHIEQLMSTLHAERNKDIAYSGCRVVQYRLKGDKLNRSHEESCFEEHYKPGRLLLENYIPLNSLMIRSQVFRTHYFAEDIDSYEDWLFLAEAELSGFNFIFTESVTAEYCTFNDTLASLHEKKGYTKNTSEIQKRILSMMKPENLAFLKDLFSSYNEENSCRQENLNNKLTESNRALNEKNSEIAEHKNLLKRAEQDKLQLSKSMADFERMKIRLSDIAQKTAIVAESPDEIISGLVIKAMGLHPKFSIIMAVHNPPLEAFHSALTSIKNQVYPNWELCIVDDASSSTKISDTIHTFCADTQTGKQVYFKRLNTHSGISQAFNLAATMGSGEYYVLMDHDDWLHPEALLEAALARNQKPYKFLYTDSQTIDLKGTPRINHHKPDWSPETLYYWNYINHLAVIDRKLWETIGGFRPEMDGTQDWDLYLRLTSILEDNDVVHIKRPLYGWRSSQNSLAYRVDAKPWVKEKWFQLLNKFHSDLICKKNAANERQKSPLNIEFNPKGPGFLVSSNGNRDTSLNIIIPTKDNLTCLEKCLNALDEDSYLNKTITLVNNGSLHEDLQELCKKYCSNNISIINDNRPFNWSSLNNLAAARSDADAYLFMNDDVVLSGNDSIEKMTYYLNFKEIGIVGAFLIFPEGGIQHNGICLSPEWIADEIRQTGGLNVMSAPRNVSAVTGACMLVRKKTFDDLNGFNEDLPENYNDVDFCLSARSKNWRIMMASDVTAQHYHMSTRGKSSRPKAWETAYMKKKWSHVIKEERLFIRWENLDSPLIYLNVDD